MHIFLVTQLSALASGFNHKSNNNDMGGKRIVHEVTRDALEKEGAF